MSLQLRFVIFCRKGIGAKAARKMLVKLTTVKEEWSSAEKKSEDVVIMLMLPWR